jgi:hypothetical protein
MYRRLLGATTLIAVMLTLTACPTGTKTNVTKSKVATGSKVTVQVQDPKLSKPATITFGTVTSEGEVSLASADNPPPLPAGASLTLGTVFDISTTATFDKATVCFEDSAVSAKSKILHFSAQQWNDRTSSVNPPQICGDFTSFSPVAIVDTVTASPTPSPSSAPTATPTAAATATPSAAATVTATPTATAPATPTPTQAQQQTEAPTQAPTAPPTQAPTQAPTAAPTTPAPTLPPTPSPTPAFNAIPRQPVPPKLGIWGRVTGPDGTPVGGACVTLGPPIRCFTFTSNQLNAADSGYFSIDLDALAAPSGSQWDFYVITGGTYTKVAFAQFYSGKFVVAAVVQKDVKLSP